jgi:5'-methylthioadenosine phosphorylase
MGPQHIKAKPGDVAARVVVSGDPARVVQLSGLLKSRRLVSENRGLLTYTGEYKGQGLTISCHGIGGPSTAIVVEELVMLGAKAIVRLGSCGGLLKPMKVGDMVIATEAGYKGGTLDQYFAKRIAPKPDRTLTKMLEDSARKLGAKYYAGPVFSSDAFYAEDLDFAKTSAKEGYVAIEMECATLFGLGRLRRVRTASVLLVSDNVTEALPIVDAEALREQATRAGRMVFETLGRLEV